MGISEGGGTGVGGTGVRVDSVGEEAEGTIEGGGSTVGSGSKSRVIGKVGLSQGMELSEAGGAEETSGLVNGEGMGVSQLGGASGSKRMVVPGRRSAG